MGQPERENWREKTLALGLLGFAILAVALPIPEETFRLDIFLAKSVAVGIGGGLMLYAIFKFWNHGKFL